MMWIVRLALSRPYTFVVTSLLIVVMGVLAIMTMSVDIFPKINIPVVTSIWSYGGLSPEEMQDRITTIVERALTTTVNNIEHIESQSVRGNSVIKMYFQPAPTSRIGGAGGRLDRRRFPRPHGPGPRRDRIVDPPDQRRGGAGTGREAARIG